MENLKLEIVTLIVVGINIILTGIKSRQENKNKQVLQEIEERRIRDAEELEKRRAEELIENERIKKLEEERAVYTVDALMAISRQFIVSEHRRITDRLDENGNPYIFIHERDSLTKLNKAYHNLGGNGLIKSLMHDIEDLDVKQR